MCSVKIGRLGKFDLNPRGELWRKDENRFGHKLLSKFGWSQGKGLGKNEDGIAENLKVRLKIGNTGVGWDEKLPIGIDYREYDSVLEDLSKKFQKSGEVKNEMYSLEKRSQQFKNRIHYQKFVRGKDTSRYSEKDLSCIFLSKETEKEIESMPKESTVTNIESRPTDPAAKESVPTFNSQLSIADYFAMKMKNKMGSNLNAPKESSQSETDTKSKKRKLEFKSSKKAKRMKPEPGTAEGSLSNEEESTSEFSSSSQEAPEEMEQFLNADECNSESVKKKKKMSKKEKKLFKSKQDTENNLQEEINMVEKNLTEEKSLKDQCQEKIFNSTEFSTAGASLPNEEEIAESSSSSQEAPEEIPISKQQFQNVEKCDVGSVKKKKKLSKKAKKLLNLSKSKQEIVSNQQESNVVGENTTEDKTLESQSWEDSYNCIEEPINMTEKEVKCKKRKHKSCKKAKKRRLEEVDISAPIDKNSSHSETDDNEKKISEECTIKTEKQSHKESKKHKNKIFNLKSCLKNLSNNTYSFKQKQKVSFCENISYKIIENVVSNNFDSDVVLETNEQLLSCSDEDCTDGEVQNEMESIDTNHVDDSNSSGESSYGNVQCTDEDMPCHENLDVVEDNTLPECFKLPKPRSANYDSWLETQRIAARMKVYKNMAKKMKKHPVLRKTNLLDIKGYGNWGV